MNKYVNIKNNLNQTISTIEENIFVFITAILISGVIILLINKLAYVIYVSDIYLYYYTKLIQFIFVIIFIYSSYYLFILFSTKFKINKNIDTLKEIECIIV